jgi:SAM-dependent methyltransferase
MESETEWLRLEQKTDPLESSRELQLTGLRPGMRALDAGGGTGAVGRVMARLVGAAGRVVVLDRSAARLRAGARLAAAEGQANANIDFVQGDLEQPPDREGAFDYVWCRFVFEYLPRPDRVFENLVRAARLGGRVVVGDLDGNGVQHHPLSPALASGLQRLTEALGDRFDPFAGRKLFSRARAAGLGDIAVHIQPYHVYAGSIPAAELPNWQEKLRIIEPAALRAFGSAGAYREFVELFLTHLQDPDSFMYSTLILVSGNRLR